MIKYYIYSIKFITIYIITFLFKLKVAARQAAIEAGVQVVPGTPGPVTLVDEVKEFVHQFGTPIIIKAAYGGGGRGMRKVEHESEVIVYFFIFFILLFYR